MTIWKFPLELTDTQQVKMPISTQILTAQIQDGNIMLWGIVPDNEVNRRDTMLLTIEIHGTGSTTRSPHGLTYVGTVQSHAGMFIWHVFHRDGASVK